MFLCENMAARLCSLASPRIMPAACVCVCDVDEESTAPRRYSVSLPDLYTVNGDTSVTLAVHEAEKDSRRSSARVKNLNLSVAACKSAILLCCRCS